MKVGDRARVISQAIAPCWHNKVGVVQSVTGIEPYPITLCIQGSELALRPGEVEPAENRQDCRC